MTIVVTISEPHRVTEIHYAGEAMERVDANTWEIAK